MSSDAAADHSRLLSIFDVAERLHCHPQTIRHYARTGEIPMRRVGGRWAMTEADFDAWWKMKRSS